MSIECYREMTLDEMEQAGMAKQQVDQKRLNEGFWEIERELKKLLNMAYEGRSIPKDLEDLNCYIDQFQGLVSLVRGYVEDCLEKKE